MSLRGARTKKKSRFSLNQKKPIVRYGRFHVQGFWDVGQAKPFQFTVTWKSLILVGIAMAMIVVPSYGYYSNIYLPSFPNPIHNPYDPFTLLWNGTTTSSGR